MCRILLFCGGRRALRSAPRGSPRTRTRGKVNGRLRVPERPVSGRSPGYQQSAAVDAAPPERLRLVDILYGHSYWEARRAPSPRARTLVHRGSRISDPHSAHQSDVGPGHAVLAQTAHRIAERPVVASTLFGQRIQFGGLRPHSHRWGLAVLRHQRDRRLRARALLGATYLRSNRVDGRVMTALRHAGVTIVTASGSSVAV